MNHKNKILNVGLLADSHIASKYIFDLAEWGQKQDNLKIKYLVVQRIKRPNKLYKKIANHIKGKNLLNIIQNIGFTIIKIIESCMLSKNKLHGDHLKKFDLKLIFKNIIEIKPIVSKSGFIYRYSSEEIKKILNLNLDVLIRCGSGILRGEILNCARFGIISFHHGDNTINRGGPPGFWEVYFKQDSTGFTIQQLTEELDGGNILMRGHVTTQPWYLLNQANLYLKSYFFIKKFLIELSNNHELPKIINSIPYFNPLYKQPNIYVQLNYSGYLVSKLFNSIIDKYILRRSNSWGVAFSYNDWKKIAMWNSVKIQNTAGHFLADPFVYSCEKGNYCFVEDFDYNLKKGSIKVYKLYETRAEEVGQAIVEKFHLSYPYLFEYESKLYMCPESAENRDIRIYECIEFPLEWKLKKIIKSNVSAVDSTIFEFENLWWLFTSIDSLKNGDNCSELHIYFSKNPLTDNWEPHNKNPIFVDSRKARMGGLIIDEKKIYRVGQRQGFYQYGKSLSINEIITLNKNEYIEQLITEIEANFFPGLSGTHHLHSNGKITVFDFVKICNINN